ncbi:MAG: cytochrome c [Bryobacteraceae bacterium]
MRSSLQFASFTALGGLLCATALAGDVTFSRDVAPILQNRCQVCHRPGDIAPMSFLTYKETRPWAKAIRNAVTLRKMPPWFADQQIGHFANDRSLSQSEIDTLVAWADHGASEGNPADAPKVKVFNRDWKIGKPDAVVEIPVSFHVPASGEIAYQYIVVPTGFTEDKWVTAVEVRPSNPRVVHHIIASHREPRPHGTSIRRGVYTENPT